MNGLRTVTRLLSVVLCCGASAYGEWSEATLFAELNDFQNSYVASEPTVSTDGLSMVFVRDVSPANSHLFEAWRETPNGPFTSERALVELNPLATLTKGPWLSQDNLRLYYSQAIPEGGKWASYQVIKMATRSSPSDVWQEVRTLSELHVPKTADFGAVLTADELTIVWFSRRPNPTADPRIFTASRNSVDEPFSNERELPELKQMGAYDLHLSADGLRMYFHAARPDTEVPNVYVAARSSLAEPFSNPQVLEGICGPGLPASRPWLSADEKTIYFNSFRGDGLDQRGIWVSYWVEDPYDVAVGRIEAAIAAKREAIAFVNETLESDRLALEALNELRKAGTVDPVNILKAKIEIFRAIQRQLAARRELERSIADLEQSLAHLQAEPRQNLERKPAPARDKPVGPKDDKIVRGKN